MAYICTRIMIRTYLAMYYHTMSRPTAFGPIICGMAGRIRWGVLATTETGAAGWEVCMRTSGLWMNWPPIRPKDSC